MRACSTEVGRILTRKGITSSPTTEIDATSVVDVPVVASLKLEKRSLGGDILASTFYPAIRLPIDWSGLSCLSTPALIIDFIPRLLSQLIPYHSSPSYQRACFQTGLDALSSLHLVIPLFSRILRIQLEQTAARASFLHPLLRFICLPLNLICNPEATNSEESNSNDPTDSDGRATYADNLQAPVERRALNHCQHACLQHPSRFHHQRSCIQDNVLL